MFSTIRRHVAKSQQWLFYVHENVSRWVLQCGWWRQDLFHRFPDSTSWCSGDIGNGTSCRSGARVNLITKLRWYGRSWICILEWFSSRQSVGSVQLNGGNVLCCRWWYRWWCVRTGLCGCGWEWRLIQILVFRSLIWRRQLSRLLDIPLPLSNSSPPYSSSIRYFQLSDGKHRKFDDINAKVQIYDKNCILKTTHLLESLPYTVLHHLHLYWQHST